MKKKITNILTRTLVFYSALLAPVFAFAQSPAPQSKINSGAEAARPDGGPASLVASFKTIANVLIFLVGAVAVIVLILGGFTYVTSTGDPARIKRAKDTILYGVVGVVVAILAYAIVNFVIGALT